MLFKKDNVLKRYGRMNNKIYVSLTMLMTVPVLYASNKQPEGPLKMQQRHQREQIGLKMSQAGDKEAKKFDQLASDTQNFIRTYQGSKLRRLLGMIPKFSINNMDSLRPVIDKAHEKQRQNLEQRHKNELLHQRANRAVQRIMPGQELSVQEIREYLDEIGGFDELNADAIAQGVQDYLQSPGADRSLAYEFFKQLRDFDDVTAADHYHEFAPIWYYIKQIMIDSIDQEVQDAMRERNIPESDDIYNLIEQAQNKLDGIQNFEQFNQAYDEIVDQLIDQVQVLYRVSSYLRALDVSEEDMKGLLVSVRQDMAQLSSPEQIESFVLDLLPHFDVHRSDLPQFAMSPDLEQKIIDLRKQLIKQVVESRFKELGIKGDDIDWFITDLEKSWNQQDKDQASSQYSDAMELMDPKLSKQQVESYIDALKARKV